MSASETFPAIVVGGGQVGLAAGYQLQRTGLKFIILESSSQVGGSWPSYYDSLTLFSPARYSSLPGFPFPGSPHRYPRRDEVVRYLREYALRFNLPVATGTRVLDVRRVGNEFHVETSDSRVYRALNVIAATGNFRTPHLPDCPGRENFRGHVLHSASYREPRSFTGQRVVVVGGGNSAVQIAVELSRVAHVTLASRAPVRFVPQRIAGCDLHCWTHWTRLEFTSWLKDHNAPVLDFGEYRRALARRRPDRRAMFLRFTKAGVVWPDIGPERIDTVIFATGFRAKFPYLRQVGAVDDHGTPIQSRGVSSVPGLYFVGLSGQRSLRSATLRGVGDDAAYIVKSLRRHLNDPNFSHDIRQRTRCTRCATESQ